MFLFTVTKPGLRQAGALALCAVCLAGTVTAAVRLAGKSVAASATVQTTIENTQDIGTYFTGYGFEVDLSTAAVDKVKIPKKWDDSFTAFNQVVGESGLTLADYKGKTVEKWTVLCPARSDGATDTYCVLLVYKAKPVGAYLLEKALRRGERFDYRGPNRRRSRTAGRRNQRRPAGRGRLSQRVSRKARYRQPTGIKRVTALCRWAVWLCVRAAPHNSRLAA